MITQLVFVTVPNVDVGKTIARVLLEERLAACINVVPAISSLYWWQGKIQEDQEGLILIKTSQDSIQALQDRLHELHPYDTPEFIAIAVDQVSAKYLGWLESNLAVNSHEE